MKNCFCGFMIVFSLLISSNLHAGKLDPFWKIQRDMKAKVAGVEKGAGTQIQIMIDVFIKSSDTIRTEQRVLSVGGQVRTIISAIMTATLPSDVIDDAATWPEVQYIEAGKPLKPMNDLADADTGVTAVHAGTGLPHGYDGTGVIVALIDSGIDITHPAFKDADGESRILYIWDQEDNAGPGPAEISSTYGTEYKHAAIVAATPPHRDTSGHGTHTSGTAAGLDSTYPGVASNAGIIMVRYKSPLVGEPETFSTYVCDAANYIYQKAAYLGRPASINVSLGSHYGPHDGTSLFEQCVDGLLSEASGRAMVVSAGNEGSSVFPLPEPLADVTGGIHASFGASGGQTASYFNIYERNALSTIDVWGPQDCVVDIAVGVDDGGGWVGGSSWVSNGGNIEEFFYDSGITLLGNVWIDRTETENSQNGKWHAYINIIPGDNYSFLNYGMALLLDGNCSSIEAWAEPSNRIFFYDFSGASVYPGDNSKTICPPATANNVIAVGAYLTRTSWTDSGGNPQSDPDGLLTTIGDLAYFSSRGPALNTAQGQKPNLTAPGVYIISAYSSATESPDATRQIDGTHTIMEGTSMAAPHVTGIVALLLQAYPSLTYDQIISYLQSTARADSFVGSSPNGNWGYGKVDAAAAVTAVTAAYPPGTTDGDFSGITITGLSDAGSVSNDTKEFSLTFPRQVLASTCSTDNIFIAPVSGASASITKASWDSSACNVGSALPASTSIDSNTQVRLILNSPIGEGNFVLCISPLVRDAEEIKFGGKTVEFAGVSSGGGGGGGCHITVSKSINAPISVLLSVLACATLLLLRKRLMN